MGRIVGLGGIFFKCADPNGTRDWYRDHFGLKTTPYGVLFEFRKSSNPDEKGYTQWSPFSQTTKYLDPSTKDFMINYRVEGIESLLEDLKKAGVEIIGEMQTFDFGKFAHVMDPEGNKVELWEPIDSGFGDKDKSEVNFE